MINGIKNCKKAKYIKGITLIALVVTIVVLLILASVSITVVFGDNGILQLAKEAGEKTNESVQGDKENIGNMTNYIKSLSWDTAKVTAVTTKDGGIVPVPKGFVGSEVDGENTIKDGFVIYEIPEGKNLNWQADENKDGILDVQQDCNQFVWVPADGVNLEYKQDKETWSSKTYWYNECKDHWTDEESEEEQKIVKREESVAKYGGFYVGRYEAGVEESKNYTDGSVYQGTKENRNNTNGKPVIKRGRQAWNNVSQINAKALSEKMYKDSTSVASRLIDSYAWDTICTWLSNNGVDVVNSTTWGNYVDASYTIKGLYALHTYKLGVGWIQAETYSRTSGDANFKLPEGRVESVTEANPERQSYEVETGVKVIDELGNEIDRNKVKNIYDFAGNMCEWTTEIEKHNEKHSIKKWTATFAVVRGGNIAASGISSPAVSRSGDFSTTNTHFRIGFRPVIYLKIN